MTAYIEIRLNSKAQKSRLTQRVERIAPYMGVHAHLKAQNESALLISASGTKESLIKYINWCNRQFKPEEGSLKVRQ